MRRRGGAHVVVGELAGFGAHVGVGVVHLRAGVTGEEENRFYDRVEGKPVQKGDYLVKQGTGVCFLPDDLHSIHIQAPLINFHMYGLGLDQLHKREFYKADEGVWRVFPAHADIREAR